jgi:hypothetical protein
MTDFQKYERLEGLTADKRRVFDLMDHLRRAFEDFCNTYHEPVPFMDAFMGVHNFHKLIIGDLIRRTEMPPDAAKAFATMAADTFRKAMADGKF